MNILNLVLSLSVEVHELLSSRSARCLLVVRGKGVVDALDAAGDAVSLICGLSLLGSLVLGVEVLESLEEAAGNTVLLVEIESALSSLVSENVSVSEVLGDDTGSWLLLLSNLIRVLGGGWAILKLLCTLGARDGNLGPSKLSVIEQKGSLSCGLLLEGHRCALALSGWSDFNLGDLSAEAEEPK